jgi:hypothetical protein
MEGHYPGHLQQAQGTAPSVIVAGSRATSRPTAHGCSFKDGLQGYRQKLKLLGKKPREHTLRKVKRWSIRIDHRGRVRSPDTRNIQQIFLRNGTQRRQMSQNGMTTSTMILEQSIE